ncbi:aspartate/glutamate racemase family protein [Actinomadura sp. 9N407]|uniref:aspartate/glutamate racemase family protein n=1 Tax=Actinomadura sp. 9N407 TaxID=3375154 RepID=UPI00379DA6DF
MKILWQSFTTPGSKYHAALHEYLTSLAKAGTTVEVEGLSPADDTVHRLSEARCGYQVVRQNLDAPQRGYDAVVIGHFQDGGLHELRSALDIPVAGLGESSMHQAMMLGEAFGLVTIHPGFSWYHRQQVERYGIQARFAGVRAMETTAQTYFRAFEGEEESLALVVKQFREEAMRLVEAGAEVIIPAGGLPALLLWRTELLPDLDGAAVLDPIGAALGTAEMWAHLGSHHIQPGRRGPFARADQTVLDDFRTLRPESI